MPPTAKKSPMRVVKNVASQPTKKTATRSAAPTQAQSKPPFTAKVCIPHLQFHGDYVIFCVFYGKPPQDVHLALKENGAKYRRAPPHIDAKMGWHLKCTAETVKFYQAIKKPHKEFAKQIADCINVIQKKPHMIECPSRSSASTRARRITDIIKVK